MQRADELADVVYDLLDRVVPAWERENGIKREGEGEGWRGRKGGQARIREREQERERERDQESEDAALPIPIIMRSQFPHGLTMPNLLC